MLRFEEKEKARAAARLGSLGLTVLAQEPDGDDSAEFVGGIARLEAVLSLRNKAMAAVGLAHLKPLTAYTTELFDRALEKPASKAYRSANVSEIIAADRQAWEEVLRLVGAKTGSLDSCLMHVCKAGGLLSSLLRPVLCEQGQNSASTWVCFLVRFMFWLVSHFWSGEKR